MNSKTCWLPCKKREEIDSIGRVSYVKGMLLGFPAVPQPRFRRSPSPFRKIGAGAYLIATCCSLITGCQKSETETEQKPESRPDLPTPEMVVSEEKAEQDKIGHQAADLLVKRDFATLDKSAHELREGKRVYPDGTWALRSFYSGLETVPKDAPDSQWTARIAILSDWIKTVPDSITPRVALVETLVSYAWKARGTGYANTVTDEGGKLMAQRLGVAHKILVEARNLHEKCPRWWPAAQNVALGEGWDIHTYDRLCDEGLSLFPENQAIYLYKAYELQPRWHGKPGEWEDFATASAQKVGGDQGEMLYARMIWYLNEKGLFHNIFADSAVKWDRVKRSFEVLQRMYPDSLPVLSEFAGLSCNAGDWKKARELFASIGGRVDTSIFPKKEIFVRYRNDAYTHL